MDTEGARQPRRVFLGLVEIAGYYRNLCEGLRGHGIDCVFVDLSGNPFQYGGPRQPVALRALEALARSKQRARGPYRLVLAALIKVLKAPLFVWAALRFDTFVLGYRSTFFAFRELRILRGLGKQVVYCFHGSDARPPYLDGSVMALDRRVSIEACLAETRRTRTAINRIERHASAIVSHGPFAHFQRRPFVSFLALGVPAEARTPAVPTKSGSVRALHAPSDPAAKGTQDIRAMVHELQRQGYDLELREVVGQPHDVVLRELADCDLVIDQLYSDTPMAGLAAEAAACGLPAVIGGYDSAAIVREVPQGRVPPTAFCDPADVPKAIARLVDDAAERRSLGERARRFVIDEWSPAQVAARWIRLLEGTAPHEWLVDPASVGYVHGCGLSADRSRQLIAAVVEAAGPSALGVDDKPPLRQALLEIARAGPS
ncbi:MAG TPA: glycosyltransferase [Acidimicrobiales bacterium]|jgi:hypothetical protein|nr:glycosyltransferase [Acidimicrobiales bacterium]